MMMLVDVVCSPHNFIQNVHGWCIAIVTMTIYIIYTWRQRVECSQRITIKTRNNLRNVVIMLLKSWRQVNKWDAHDDCNNVIKDKINRQHLIVESGGDLESESPWWQIIEIFSG